MQKTPTSVEVLQMISVKFQMALFPASLAVVAGRVARAEAAVSAQKADRLALVQFGVLQHSVVEHVSQQHVVASVAAPRVGLAVALDALFRICFEAFWDLFNTARGAGMAR